jgi:surface antigen
MLRAISTITAALVIGLSALGGVATASGGGTGYPAGQCTAYVASQLSWVPSDWGNADLWLIDGRRSGFTTVSGADVVAVHPGDVAVIAADAQTRNGKASGDGHVGIVTAVDRGAGTVTLSSENWPEGDSQPRSLTFDTSDIEGYIEPPAGASMPASALGDFAERAPQVNLPLPRTAE